MSASRTLAPPRATHFAYSLGARPLVAIVILMGLVAALFLPVVNHKFLLWDDPVYVTGNPEIADGLTWRALVWAFTEVRAANWHPLTWASHMFDVDLWGMWPGGHHLSSVAWHALNAGLLFALLFRVTGGFWRSSVVAMLFGIHPLHVESVAWIAERKDVLSGFFWLLTLLLYERYTRGPSIRRYLAVTAALAAGLMAKPMLVTLPLVMLLLDVWPLRRVTWDSGTAVCWRDPTLHAVFVEKLPWVALSLLSGLITLHAQTGAIVPVTAMPWSERLSMAVIAYATYLWQTVWPVELSFFYRPRADWLPAFAGAVATIVAASWAVLHAWRRGNPVPLVGWGWYLLSLLPVIGIIKVGPQAHADRYTYLPLIGIFLALAFAVPTSVLSGVLMRRAASVAMAALLALTALISWRQVGYWAADEALYRRAIAVDPDNYVAHLQLAETHRVQGNLVAAENAASRAMEFGASPLVAYYGGILLGNIAYERRQPAVALMHYQRALQVLPASPLAHYNVGTVWLTLGDARQAQHHFVEALRHDARYSDALSNLGVARLRLGDSLGARQAYQDALRFHPNNLGARYNLARLEMQLGQVDAARGELVELLRRAPGHLPARQALASLPGGDAR